MTYKEIPVPVLYIVVVRTLYSRNARVDVGGRGWSGWTRVDAGGPGGRDAGGPGGPGGGRCSVGGSGWTRFSFGQVGIFQNLNQNLPACAARENLRKFACPECTLHSAESGP